MRRLILPAVSSSTPVCTLRRSSLTGCCPNSSGAARSRCSRASRETRCKPRSARRSAGALPSRYATSWRRRALAVKVRRSGAEHLERLRGCDPRSGRCR